MGSRQLIRKTEQGHHLCFLSQTGKGLKKISLIPRGDRFPPLLPSLMPRCKLLSFVFFIVGGGEWKRGRRKLVTVGGGEQMYSGSPIRLSHRSPCSTHRDTRGSHLMSSKMGEKTGVEDANQGAKDRLFKTSLLP